MTRKRIAKAAPSLAQPSSTDDEQIHRLTEIDTQFVSLVRAGANRTSAFMVVKADEPPAPEGQPGETVRICPVCDSAPIPMDAMVCPVCGAPLHHAPGAEAAPAPEGATGDGVEIDDGCGGGRGGRDRDRRKEATEAAAPDVGSDTEDHSLDAVQPPASAEQLDKGASAATAPTTDGTARDCRAVIANALATIDALLLDARLASALAPASGSAVPPTIAAMHKKAAAIDPPDPAPVIADALNAELAAARAQCATLAAELAATERALQVTKARNAQLQAAVGRPTALPTGQAQAAPTRKTAALWGGDLAAEVRRD